MSEASKEMYSVQSNVHSLGNFYHDDRSAPSPILSSDAFSMQSGLNSSYNFSNSQANDSNDVIVVVDTMPKQEYYLTLRNQRKIASRSGSLDFLDSRCETLRTTTNSSMVASRPSLIGTMNYPQKSDSLGLINKPSSKFQRVSGRRGIDGVHCPEKLMNEFKPSNKIVSCNIILIDGSEIKIEADKESYGQHVFDSVCEHMYIEENEYFSLTFVDNKRQDIWLAMDKKVKTQLPKSSKHSEWNFQLKVRFYPYELNWLKDCLTQHLVCTQIRQDLVDGSLPVSFYNRVILAASIIQSDVGDFDPCTHTSIEYLTHIPIAPSEIQTRDFMLAVRDAHRYFMGLTPEEADRHFLNNARKCALYGMHFHDVKIADDPSPISIQQHLKLGVYHNGLILCKNGIRISRHSWASMHRFGFKGKKFSLLIRAFDTSLLNSVKSVSEKPSKKGAIGISETNSNNNSSNPEKVQIIFKCRDEDSARRLYTDCLHHHQFFRLRESRKPNRPVLFSGYTNARRYTLSRNNTTARSESNNYSPSQSNFNNSLNDMSTSTSLHHKRMRGANNNGNGMKNLNTSSPHHTVGMNGRVNYQLKNQSIREEDLAPNSTLWPHKSQTRYRPDIRQAEWKLSTIDRTDKAIVRSGPPPAHSSLTSYPGSGWQSARSTKAVRFDPNLKETQRYYYEVTMLGLDEEVVQSVKEKDEKPQVRVGWSTQSASLMPGSDHESFAFGSRVSSHNESEYCSKIIGLDCNDGTDQGVKASHGVLEVYGRPVWPGDIIGCYLDLSNGELQWSVNGKSYGRAYTMPNSLRNEAFFPISTVLSGQALINFGPKFCFPPNDESDWVALASCQSEANCLHSEIKSSWRLNTYDCDDGCELSTDGLLAQCSSNLKSELKVGARSCQGIKMSQSKTTNNDLYLFEIRMLELNTIGSELMIGFSETDSQLTNLREYIIIQVIEEGLGNLKCFSSVDNSVSFCHWLPNQKQCVTISENDVIGLVFSLNGKLFILVNGIPVQEFTVFDDISKNIDLFPTVCLQSEMTVQLNFGECEIWCPPQINDLGNCGDVKPLGSLPSNLIAQSVKKGGNKRRLKGFSYIPDQDELHKMIQAMHLNCENGSTDFINAQENEITSMEVSCLPHVNDKTSQNGVIDFMPANKKPLIQKSSAPQTPVTTIAFNDSNQENFPHPSQCAATKEQQNSGKKIKDFPNLNIANGVKSENDKGDVSEFDQLLENAIGFVTDTNNESSIVSFMLEKVKIKSLSR